MIEQGLRQSFVLCAGGIFFSLFFISTYTQPLAFFVGGVWGAINCYALKELIKCVLVTKNNFLFVIIVLIKFPILYLFGYFLLKQQLWDPWFLAMGLPISFVFIVGHLLKMNSPIQRKLE